MQWEHRERENFAENIMLRGLSVEKVLRQVLADSDSKEEYSPSDDDVQSAGESQSVSLSLTFPSSTW